VTQNNNNTRPVAIRPARSIAVTSGKGGVGKSTLSLNLALELSRRGQRVCLFDADTNLANITIMTGLAPEKTLADWLAGKAGLKQLLLEGPQGLYIVPAASGLIELVDLDVAQQRRLLELLQRLERDFDFLVIDTAAGADRRVLSFLQAAGEVLIVITTEPTSLTDAFSLLKLLHREGYRRPVQVVVNRAPDFEQARDTLIRFASAVRKYIGLRVVAPGYVFDDPLVSVAVNRQQPLLELFPDSRAGQCLRNFTRSLLQRNSTPGRSLSAWLSAQGGVAAEPLQRLIEDPDADWVDAVVERIRNEPLEDVRLWMQLFSGAWQKRLRQEAVKSGEERRRQGFLAAVRFAARAGRDAATPALTANTGEKPG
jgi:MinD-like ATPase involved in chromosome partitioning or flagellar assembly